MERRNELAHGKKCTVRYTPKMTSHNVVKILTCICLTSLSAISTAETTGLFAIVESKPISEFWLNAGFYSYHFQKDRGFNDNNLGLGVEYRHSTVASIAVGGFHNSDWHTSHYIGWYWRPLALGPVHFGAVVGGVDGYPRVNNGGWFPAVIPAASLEYKSIGANVTFIPSYKERLNGALSLQLKVKVY